MKFQFHKKDQETVSISKKRWSDFHFDGNVFTSQMDPETQAMRYPTPNPLYGQRNRVYDVEYLGGPNDADTTVAVATLDRKGSEYKLFDAGVLPLQFAYLGLGMTSSSKNDGYNEQFVNVMLESLSAAYATQLTDLAFLTANYTTTIPKMESGQAGVVGALVWYQTIPQNVASIMAKYNTLMSMNDYLIKMGYNGEAPITTGIMNLLKKQNVYSLLDRIGVVLSQEYFDLQWFNEITVLNGLPSKIADDVQTPLLTICGSTYIPGITIKVGETTVFDTINDGQPGYADFNEISFTVDKETTTVSFQQLCQLIMTYLDPVNILSFARQVHEGIEEHTLTWYANMVVASLEALLKAISAWKNATVDIRTFLMVLQDRTNLNRWIFGTPYVSPRRPREQLTPAYVRVVHDIFRSYGTNGQMVYDTTTRKWKVYTMWKGGDGIPEYDAYNGGFAIAASVRAIPENDAGYGGPDYMFPRMFYRYEEDGSPYYQRFVNRLGTLVEMGVTDLNATQLASNPYFAYINMLSAEDVTIQVPTIALTTVTTDYVLMSTINKLLVSLFGIGIGKFGSGGSAITNYAIDTDDIGLVGRQYGNFSEASVEYLTARAPLRQIDKDVNIGFRTARVSPDTPTENWDGPRTNA